MGTWGTGTFDSDGARDYLDEVIDRFTATVTETLDDEDRAALDEQGEAVIMPSIEILALLCEQLHAYPPDEATVVGWRDRYLEIYDEQIDGLATDPAFIAERRAVIVETFERLLRYAHRAESDRD